MMWFFRKKEKVKTEPVGPVVSSTPQSLSMDDFLLDQTLDQETQDILSIVVSAVCAADRPQSKFRFISAAEIDIEKEMAVVLASSQCGEIYPTSTMKVTKVEEIKHVA